MFYWGILFSDEQAVLIYGFVFGLYTLKSMLELFLLTVMTFFC